MQNWQSGARKLQPKNPSVVVNQDPQLEEGSKTTLIANNYLISPPSREKKTDALTNIDQVKLVQSAWDCIIDRKTRFLVKQTQLFPSVSPATEWKKELRFKKRSEHMWKSKQEEARAKQANKHSTPYIPRRLGSSTFPPAEWLILTDIGIWHETKVEVPSTPLNLRRIQSR